MEEENFSLYKNIKKLCKGIYQSIKNNNSEQINSYIDTFGQLNSELQNKINLKNMQGGYSKEIEQLKNSIIQKINYMKDMRGGKLSDENTQLKSKILESIKNFSTKDFSQQLKKIEESLGGIKKFIETYKSLQRELSDKNNIINTKYNDKDSFRALMATINPTELTILQNQLQEFTQNIKAIVDDTANPPENLESTIKQTCRNYIPQPAPIQATSPGVLNLESRTADIDSSV